jgi:hypothetical protein
MDLFTMQIIVHPGVTDDGAWVIFSRNAPQVPADLQRSLPVPCILTGDLSQTERALAFLRVVSSGADPEDPFISKRGWRQSEGTVP